jgi:bifunctional non-homologous end joining protein LigD
LKNTNGNVISEKGGAASGKAGVAEGFFLSFKSTMTRLHYDLRLELDGILLSWAVTKGRLNPSDRRFGRAYEDHPPSYGTFEGHNP